MDWTTVYVETGAEELIWPKAKTAPRLSRLVSMVYHHDAERPQNRSSHREMLSQGPQGKIGAAGACGDESEFASHRIFQLIHTDWEDERSSGEYCGYTLRALYFLTINHVLGVGILGVPYAFARAGFILCGLIIIVVTVTSYITVMWVAESGARVESEKKESASFENGDDEKEISLHEKSSLAHSTRLHFEVDRSQSFSAEDTVLLPQRQAGLAVSPASAIDSSNYEVVDLISHYLGSYHKSLYQVSLMSLMYVGLLAYTQVFCGAVLALLPSNGSSLKFLPQIIFGVIVVPLSCAELDEQVTIQSIMSVVRFVAIFIMVGGSLLALLTDSTTESSFVGEESLRHGPPYFAPPFKDGCQMSYTACFAGFGVAFSTALFSQLFQHSVPGLLRPLSGRTDKVTKVPYVFGASLLTTCTLYLLLGTVAASYFGASTKSSINLNFVDFTFGFDLETTPHFILSGCRFASGVVVMFPALDTLSVFPLIANTLGSNLFAASSPGFTRWIMRHQSTWKRLWESAAWFINASPQNQRGLESTNSVVNNEVKTSDQHEKKKLAERVSRHATLFWRVVAAIPPLVGSIFATNLSFSLLLAGVAGLYVAFFAPALLHLASFRPAEISSRTVFSGWYSRNELAYAVLAFSMAALIVVVVQIRHAWINM